MDDSDEIKNVSVKVAQSQTEVFIILEDVELVSGMKLRSMLVTSIRWNRFNHLFRISRITKVFWMCSQHLPHKLENMTGSADLTDIPDLS